MILSSKGFINLYNETHNKQFNLKKEVTMAYFETKDKCKLYYELHGEGEPVVLIHGWTCNADFYQYQIPVFSEKYQVLAYDLRGHGRSDKSAEATETNMSLDTFAKDLYELIEGLGLKNVNLVGWSMGTSIILNYIDIYGNENLKSICCIDMTPKLLADDEWQLGQSKVFNTFDNLAFMGLVATDWSAACDAFIPNVFAEGYDQNSEMFKWCMSQAKSNLPHCMLNMWIAMAVKDYRKVLPKIEVPTFLAYSGNGLLYYPEHGKYMQENIRNSVLDIFPGCGHGLMFEDHEKFNKDYLAFLDDVYK